MPIRTSMIPVAGIDHRTEDAALRTGGDAPRLFYREALNLDVSPAGRIDLRGVPKKVSSTPYANLWHSPLHGDTFATLGTRWVKVDPADWTHVELVDLGRSVASHCVLNGVVAVASADGIWTFDGQAARPLPLHTPGPPVLAATAGGLPPGDYAVAVSFLRGTLESSVSEVAHLPLRAGGGLTVGMPYAIDPTVTAARLYLAPPGSGELQRVEDHPTNGGPVTIAALPQLGGSPEFQHLDAMPGGRFLTHWRGRLLTASARTLHLSEPLAPHLHDRRHGFVQLPQRITFVAGVEGGVWVGQVDHVVFLSGTRPEEFTVSRKAAQAPVEGSAVLVGADALGEVAQGQHAAVWLAENGYVVGTASGELVEVHRGRLQSIRAAAGRTIQRGDRLLTIMG